jgi:hypothetical protein
VLIGRGLAAWIRIVVTSVPVVPTSPLPAPCRRLAVLPDCQADLLQVWTQMALSVRSSEVPS